MCIAKNATYGMLSTVTMDIQNAKDANRCIKNIFFLELWTSKKKQVYIFSFIINFRLTKKRYTHTSTI